MVHEFCTELAEVAFTLARPEFVQGGGGNISAKMTSHGMLIKASGFEFRDLTSDRGFVMVDDNALRDYLPSASAQSEGDIAAFVAGRTSPIGDGAALRPSMEVWFHLFLKRYTLHVHDACVNAVACAAEGERIVADLFAHSDLDVSWVPYRDPGIPLAEDIRRIIEQRGRIPDVFILQNHGIIVSSDEYRHALGLHARVNDMFRSFLGIRGPYPSVRIVKISDGEFASGTEYIAERRRDMPEHFSQFEDIVVFPDQAVYSDVLRETDGDGRLIYRASERAARAFEEVLAAYLFIREWGDRRNLAIRPIPSAAATQLKSMETEKYRKNVIASS